MTEGHRTAPFVRAAFIASLTAGVALSGAAIAAADPVPVPTPTPIPSDPAAAAPGQPAAPPPPVPGGPPSVPEIANPTYGSGKNGGGVLGTLRDLWHQARDPYYGPQDGTPGASGSVAPPASAGAPPPLPPGYISYNAPGSETPATAPASGGTPSAGGPPLPPGYYPLTGPPPPGYQYNSPAPGQPAPATPTPAPTP
jgi:hypothetical protein